MTTSTTSPTAEPCCPEYAALSRRGLFAGTAALVGATTAFGSAILTASPASAASASSVLVVLSMRGAADGLSLVVPYNDAALTAARPNIKIPQGSLLEPDDTFGMHPKLAPLMTLWGAGKMAAIHATGLPTPNRSHFAAQEALEDADPGSSARVGWLNRLISTIPGSSPLQGFNMGGGVVPTSLFGPQAVMAAGNVDRVSIPGDDANDPTHGRVKSLHTLWDGNRGPLGIGMRSTFAAVKEFSPALATANHSSSYPQTDLGQALASAARVIRANIGVQALTVDQGDWDMHTGIGNLDWGDMIRNVDDFAKSVAAFFADLGDQASKVTLVTVSEFGRRVAENDNWGLDHGYGNVMFVFGDAVNGKQYYAKDFPTLHNTLDADLPVTTDYRSVLAEIVTSRFGSPVSTVFPGLRRETLGFMRSS